MAQQPLYLNPIVQFMFVGALVVVGALNVLMSIEVNRSLPKDRRLRYRLSWLPWFSDAVHNRHRQLFPDSSLRSIARVLEAITLGFLSFLIFQAIINKQSHPGN
jgi:hypothetical protein